MSSFVAIVITLHFATSVLASAPNRCNAVEDASALLQSHARLSMSTDAEHRPAMPLSSLETSQADWQFANALFEEMLGADPKSRNMSTLKVIKKMLNDTLLPGLWQAHASTEKSLEVAHQSVVQCVDETATGKMEVSNRRSVASNAKSEHASCRTEEVLEAKKEKEDCDDLDSFLNDLEFVPQPTTRNLESISDYVAKGVDWFRDASKDLIAKNHSCNTSTVMHEARKNNCRQNQSSFESHFCQYRQDLMDLQASSTSCYSATAAAYNDLKKKTEDQVLTWKAEYKSMKKIECYLDVWLGDKNLSTVDKSKPSQCEDASIDTSPMDVSYPTIPTEPAIDVSPVQEFPGSDNFVSTHYGDLKHDTVIACISETTTQTTTPLASNTFQTFNGIDDRMDMGLSSSDISTEMTWAFKSSQIDILQNYERTFDFDNGCSKDSIFVDVYTSLRMTFQVYGRGTASADNFWVLGAPHVYAFVISKTKLSAYRDGQLKGSADLAGGVPSKTRNHFWLGGSSCDSIHRWHADVYWFGVWNSALSPVQVAALSSTPNAINPLWFHNFPTQAGLFQYVRLDVSASNGASYWCIEELSFWDSQGNRLTTGTSGIASAQSEHASQYAASMAFNENGNSDESYYCSKTSNPTGWLQYEFPSPVNIASYKIERLNGHGDQFSPVAWTFQSSSDGSTWSDLDSQSGYNTWSDGQIREFKLA